MLDVRESAARQKLQLLEGVPGHSPKVARSRLEDEVSINAMLQGDASEDVINSGLAATFPRRRQDVLQGASIKKLKKLYPKLFNEDQVSN